MLKTIKKIILSCLSVLGVTCALWTILLLNPSMVYSNSTDMGNVTVYHNTELEVETEEIVNKAFSILQSADIFDDQIEISMCMNDHAFYPELFPFAGATAYAFFNKTVIYHGEPNFKDNRMEFSWEMNNYELRKYDLTYLMAHEIMHNVQHYHNPKYQISSTLGGLNWKLEGHADYIARGFKGDGLLRSKISKCQIEEKIDHVGVPVFTLEDGTIQNLWYFKCAIVIQYLMEEKDMSYDEVCKLETGLDELYNEMLEWSKRDTQ